MSSSDGESDLKRALREARSYARQHVSELSRQILDWKATGLLPEVSGPVSMRELAKMLKVVDLHGAMQMAEDFVKDAALEMVAIEAIAEDDATAAPMAPSP